MNYSDSMTHRLTTAASNTPAGAPVRVAPIPSPADALATLIRDALNAASHAGYESARYVHDATPAAVRAEATAAAERTSVAMWRAFYEYAGVSAAIRDALNELVK